ncbi:MAG: hypothetical protein KKH88_04625 [Nanoarchaeota archaeon]|nr:hypothetical protein [Nanoarchaeota archaeon]
MGKIFYYCALDIVTALGSVNYKWNHTRLAITGHENILDEGFMMLGPHTENRDPYLVGRALRSYKLDGKRQSKHVHFLYGDELNKHPIGFRLRNRDSYKRHPTGFLRDLSDFNIDLLEHIERFCFKEITGTEWYFKRVEHIPIPMRFSPDERFDAEIKNRNLTRGEMRYLSRELPGLAKSYTDRGEPVAAFVDGPFTRKKEGDTFVDLHERGELFHGGSMLAIQLGLPIVPFSIYRSPDRRLVQVDICEPVVDHLTWNIDRKDLTKIVAEIIDDKLSMHRESRD